MTIYTKNVYSILDEKKRIEVRRIVMKAVYQVIFTKDKKGEYLVEVPDLGCVTQGKDLKDAIMMARDVMGITGIALEDEGKKIPLPSKKVDIKKGAFYKDGETFTNFVDIDFGDYRKSIDNKIVRRNVSLPNWLNRACEKEHINVSRALQDVLYGLVGKKYAVG